MHGMKWTANGQFIVPHGRCRALFVICLQWSPWESPRPQVPLNKGSILFVYLWSLGYCLLITLANICDLLFATTDRFEQFLLRLFMQTMRETTFSRYVHSTNDSPTSILVFLLNLCVINIAFHAGTY